MNDDDDDEDSIEEDKHVDWVVSDWWSMMGKWQINQARQRAPMCLNESEMNELEMTHVCDKDEYERFTTHTFLLIIAHIKCVFQVQWRWVITLHLT